MKLVISLLLAGASLPFARAAGDAVDPISYLRTGHGHGGGGLQVFGGGDCARDCRGVMGCLFGLDMCQTITDDMHVDDVVREKEKCAKYSGVWCEVFEGDTCATGCGDDTGCLLGSKCDPFRDHMRANMAGEKKNCEDNGFVWCAANLCDAVPECEEGCVVDWGEEYETGCESSSRDDCETFWSHISKTPLWPNVITAQWCEAAPDSVTLKEHRA